MRYAEADLADAVAALTEARERLTTFRATTQIVDPGADLQGRMGLIAELQARLADELIRVDLLELRTGADDPRLNEGRQVTRAIEARIAAERRRLGGRGGRRSTNRDYARTLQEFSRLSVDVEIAEEAYCLGAGGARPRPGRGTAASRAISPRMSVRHWRNGRQRPGARSFSRSPASFFSLPGRLPPSSSIPCATGGGHEHRAYGAFEELRPKWRTDRRRPRDRRGVFPPGGPWGFWVATERASRPSCG